MYMYFAARNMSNDDTSFCGHLDKRSRTMSGRGDRNQCSSNNSNVIGECDGDG
jgi:hypothetical protein